MCPSKTPPLQRPSQPVQLALEQRQTVHDTVLLGADGVYIGAAALVVVSAADDALAQ